jgi:succinate dehydrogenase / fumarate reductase cytochrome b subunit
METNAANAAMAKPQAAGSISATAYNHPLLQAESAAKPGCKCGALRPPRKFHAAVGLWLTVFVGVHFSIGLTGLNQHSYEHSVGLIHRALASLPGAVLLMVLVPMLLQAGSGLYLLAKEGVQYDVKRCDRGGKLRYFLQRWSGLAMLAFLLPHVGMMRGWGASQFRGDGVPVEAVFASTAAGFHPWNSSPANSVTMLLLLAGILGTVFHIANGAWSGAILWKLVQTDQGKVRMGYASAAVGLVLAVMGCIAWYAFSLGPGVHLALASIAR